MLRGKILTLAALMFIMGVFAFPLNAHANEDVTPPSVNATVTDTTLRIEATAGFYAVEAIFINERRYNYRVDDVLKVDVRDFAGDSEQFSVYDIDFAGNRSNVVWLDNPSITPVVPTETPQQSNPFTPDGQASVLDQASERDGKDFYTFTTPLGNVFHLIIDHQRNSDNVYFLDAVTEADLIALAEQSDKKGTSAIPTPAPIVTEPADEPEPPAEPETPVKKGNNGIIIFVLLGVLAVGGAGYYFKILRPKQQAASSGDEEYEDDDGEEMEGGEMEFENEPPEDEDIAEMEDEDE